MASFYGEPDGHSYFIGRHLQPIANIRWSRPYILKCYFVKTIAPRFANIIWNWRIRFFRLILGAPVILLNIRRLLRLRLLFVWLTFSKVRIHFDDRLLTKSGRILAVRRLR
jgi:hypothetical protein